MSTPMIGHVLMRQEGVEGTRGLAYDYVFARNGVFLEAENNFIKARIRVVETEIRGLELTTERVELKHGLVPSYFLAMALRTMRLEPGLEVYLAVVEDDGYYRMAQPPQEGMAGRVVYHTLPNTVLDFHSHGSMVAHFSGTDDHDDQGFRISAVIGRLDQPRAELEMRLGIYGYHSRVRFPEVFTGEMPTDLVPALERT